MFSVDHEVCTSIMLYSTVHAEMHSRLYWSSDALNIYLNTNSMMILTLMYPIQSMLSVKYSLVNTTESQVIPYVVCVTILH